MAEQILRTSDWWQNKKFTDMVVVDPDGWDRTNWEFSWYQELISEEEFLKRRSLSTCHKVKQKQ